MSPIKLNIDGTDYVITPAPPLRMTIGGVEYFGTPVPPPPPPPPLISKTGLLLVPASADQTVQLNLLDALTNWAGEHDGATSGAASGATSYPVAIGGRQARLFTNDFTNNGGYRYHVSYATDTKSKNFVYAGDLYFENVDGLGQMELDNNQVTADDETYIFGCQADNNSGAWDITKTDANGCHWIATAVKGGPKTWPLKTWLHFEIASHRDDAGNITYDAIHFHGVTYPVGITMHADLPLGWGIGAELVNFQLGGSGASGSIKAYANNLQVARW